mmetsp:Transcript_4130/g.5500  ORF Transcript_4130/g.5500 Transcript_4130/m.5500 type:complete len:325 (-) Transcript_4130:1086-2060(-)|eukprot:CAMPEP_0204839734 /NCGR_PEP_ID=MMETSP1346-20131115/35330_1 /ASSEMBLY_ACC=CAM_ASM_000771 /TAXON_ID=215587 /ORGANISM="Aplanochytrium stocchinoi, Strain GSBS06" /LENGTH=324 /DNA_ID=CAMNT_0051976687 /DNA_START=146 /DNA_END=1120 /DNA_ORIENTATION=-
MSHNLALKLVIKLGITWLISFVFLQWLSRSFLKVNFSINFNNSFDRLAAFAELVVASFISLIISGAAWIIISLYPRWPVRPVIDIDHETSVESLLKNAQTGDVLLFSTPLDISGFFSGQFTEVLQSLALKLQGGVVWTHVGIVIKSPLDGKLYIAEATNELTAGDYVGPAVCDLKNRLATSEDFDLIAWRQLCPAVQPPEPVILNAFRWVNQVSEGKTREKDTLGEIDFAQIAEQLLRALDNSNEVFPIPVSKHERGLDCSKFAVFLLQKLEIVSPEVIVPLDRMTMPLFCADLHTDGHLALPLIAGLQYGSQRRVVLSSDKTK